MSPEATDSRQPRLRPSGYASRLYEFVYGKRNPFYDPIVAWGLGGVISAFSQNWDLLFAKHVACILSDGRLTPRLPAGP